MSAFEGKADIAKGTISRLQRHWVWTFLHPSPTRWQTPAVLINKSNILETVPLTVQQPWLSPHSILGWPLLINVDRPAFREWEKRIGNE
jgi:hypothetical protein